MQLGEILYDNLTTTTRKQARYKQWKVTCKVKVEGTRRQGYVTGVPSLSRSTSPFGEGVEHNAHTKANEGHPILLTLLPMQDAVNHYAVALKVATEPLQYKVGAISTT